MILTELPTAFVDARGRIQNLVIGPIQSVGVIESRAGTVRSNHYHKTGSHYLYVVIGRMFYEERDLDGSNSRAIWVDPGDMVFTGPMKVHRTTFDRESVVISISAADKSHAAHEDDLVRAEF